MVNINKTEDFYKQLKSTEVTIAIFRAEWCPDCKFIDPFINDVISEFSPQITAFSLNVDELKDITLKYSVLGIPSFVAFKNGEEIHRFVNRARKSREEITTFFKESLSK